MNKETILEQKVGLKLSQVGMLSKVFAMQSFANNGCNITPEQYTVLSVLSGSDGLYQRQLSSVTLKDRANITRIINILLDKGYVTKVVDTTGRKVHKIFITDKGRSIAKQVESEIYNIWKTMSIDIEEDEMNAFLSTLEKIKNNLIERTNLQL
ncbi:MAG: MarR family transcriptional regulator [Candidatus Gastranaerophilales bacterium]|nr:MarR family transcriptional regulator [Candidatus Gastranaerophilales bacterium]